MAADALAAFFSYCRQDSEFALRVAEDLKAAGANVWIDQLYIEPGARGGKGSAGARTPPGTQLRSAAKRTRPCLEACVGIRIRFNTPEVGQDPLWRSAAL